MGLALIAGAALAEAPSAAPPLPDRGICAHRGASDTHPENTLAALREAARLGAHMIEFDVALTADGTPVLMHDRSVDRTTDGTGAVASLSLAELKTLDAGSWKSPAFAGERVPTLDEALHVLPVNVWLNVHLKGGEELAQRVAQRIVAHERLHQALLACGNEAARAARRVDSQIMICNMDRPPTTQEYAQSTIALQADFIQLLARQPLDPQAIRALQENGVRINYCCVAELRALRHLFEAGIEFVLVDNVEQMLDAAERLGVRRLQPIYRAGGSQDGR